MMLAWTDKVLQDATPAQRCLIVIFMTVPFYLVYILMHALALVVPEVRVGLSVPVVWTLIGIMAVVSVIFLLMAVWIWPRRRGKEPQPVLYAWVACLSSVPFIAVSVSQGIFSSPSNLVIIGNVAVGLLLLDARAVVIGFSMAVLIMGIYDLLVMGDVLPYAPLFLPAAFPGGSPYTGWAIIRDMILVISIVSYSVLAVVFFNQFESQRRTLRRLSNTDALTGLANRRFFMARLEACCRESDQPFCLAIIDADHFKRINDTYGHAMGDEVLCALAEALQRGLSADGCTVARLGGEEFGVLLERMPLERAVTLLEALAVEIRQLRFEADAARFGVTLSMGVVACQGRNPEECLRLADLNLYHAKHGGRDRIIASPAVQEAHESLHRLA